jgi:hypothetical protein
MRMEFEGMSEMPADGTNPATKTVTSARPAGSLRTRSMPVRAAYNAGDGRGRINRQDQPPGSTARINGHDVTNGRGITSGAA